MKEIFLNKELRNLLPTFCAWVAAKYTFTAAPINPIKETPNILNPEFQM